MIPQPEIISNYTMRVCTFLSKPVTKSFSFGSYTRDLMRLGLFYFCPNITQN